MPLHPKIVAILDAYAAAGRPLLSAGSPAAARDLMASGRAALGRGPDLAPDEACEIATRSGTIPARLYSDAAQPHGLVVYLHGGGWVLGGLDDFDAVVRLLAERSGCALLSVDYRLAPEHPFPAAVEDAVDATLWASRNLSALVGANVPLIVAGDSAGGNLAAVAAAELAGTVPLAGQVLIYPVTDRDVDRPSYAAFATGGLLTRADMIWFFSHYAPTIGNDDPALAPMVREDLAAMPPAHVVTAEYDVLRDEGEAYAQRLAAAGVPTGTRRYDGLPHGFIRLHNLVDTADAAVGEIAGALRRLCLDDRSRPRP